MQHGKCKQCIENKLFSIPDLNLPSILPLTNENVEKEEEWSIFGMELKLQIKETDHSEQAVALLSAGIFSANYQQVSFVQNTLAVLKFIQVSGDIISSHRKYSKQSLFPPWVRIFFSLKK